MNKRLTIRLRLMIFAAAAVAGCSKREVTSAKTYPVVVVDMSHSQTVGGHGVPYQIPAGKGIRLDAEHFDFQKLGGPAVPNLVQIAFSKGSTPVQIYTLSHPSAGKSFVIDASTMFPVEGGSFPGFVPGQHVIISIGTPISGERYGGIDSYWIAMADVR